MKAVILSISPETCIIDISHAVEPQNIEQAAYLLWSAYRYFPRGAIFVCVVDPGVGTSRKILCVEANGFRFLIPDNGILEHVIGEIQDLRVVEVSNDRLFRREVGSTFHGRDIFAPTAAHLAKGLSIERLGAAAALTSRIEGFHRVESARGGEYFGKVIHIDQFGNVISNLLVEDRTINPVVLRIGKKRIGTFVRTYGDAQPREVFMLLGSTGLIEIAARNGNAAHMLNARLGQKIQFAIA